MACFFVSMYRTLAAWLLPVEPLRYRCRCRFHGLSAWLRCASYAKRKSLAVRTSFESSMHADRYACRHCSNKTQNDLVVRTHAKFTQSASHWLCGLLLNSLQLLRREHQYRRQCQHHVLRTSAEQHKLRKAMFHDSKMRFQAQNGYKSKETDG